MFLTSEQQRDRNDQRKILNYLQKAYRMNRKVMWKELGQVIENPTVVKLKFLTGIFEHYECMKTDGNYIILDEKILKMRLD